MGRNAAEITQEALQLPKNEQMELARALLENDSMPSPAAVDLAWDEEIERRIAAIHAGTAKGRPFAEVLSEWNQRSLAS